MSAPTELVDLGFATYFIGVNNDRKVLLGLHNGDLQIAIPLTAEQAEEIARNLLQAAGVSRQELAAYNRRPC
jgi:hypothetical protein